MGRRTWLFLNFKNFTLTATLMAASGVASAMVAPLQRVQTTSAREFVMQLDTAAREAMRLEDAQKRQLSLCSLARENSAWQQMTRTALGRLTREVPPQTLSQLQGQFLNALTAFLGREFSKSLDAQIEYDERVRKISDEEIVTVRILRPQKTDEVRFHVINDSQQGLLLNDASKQGFRLVTNILQPQFQRVASEATQNGQDPWSAIFSVLQEIIGKEAPCPL